MAEGGGTAGAAPVQEAAAPMLISVGQVRAERLNWMHIYLSSSHTRK